MKNHLSVILQFAHILFFLNFNLHVFRGTDAFQPNSHMVHKHLARAQMTTWVLERREIRFINKVIVAFLLPMLKEVIPRDRPILVDAYLK